MKPECRTTTVAALCRRMLDTRDFTPAPILADALEDAGCGDTELLEELRKPAPPIPDSEEHTVHRIETERLVNLIYSDDTAAAVAWIENFVMDIDYEDDPRHSYAWVVYQLGRALDGKPQPYLGTGEVCWNTDEGADRTRGDDATRAQLWRAWSVVTGRTVPADVDDRVHFRCAC